MWLCFIAGLAHSIAGAVLLTAIPGCFVPTLDFSLGVGLVLRGLELLFLAPLLFLVFGVAKAFSGAVARVTTSVVNEDVSTAAMANNSALLESSVRLLHVMKTTLVGLIIALSLTELLTHTIGTHQGPTVSARFCAQPQRDSSSSPPPPLTDTELITRTLIIAGAVAFLWSQPSSHGE